MYHHVPLYSIPNFSTQFRCFGHSQGNFRCFIADLWPLRWEHLCRCLVYCRIWTRMRSQGSVRVRAMALRSDVLMKFREASLLITSLVAWKGNRSFSLAKESPFLPSLLADRFGWRHSHATVRHIRLISFTSAAEFAWGMSWVELKV